MTQQCDFLIVGEDEAALGAAAGAARAGARVCLLRASRQVAPISSASFCAIPNAIWRRFDLQDYGLALEPVSARITLSKNGDTVATTASARETQNALGEASHPDGEIWAAFVAEMEQYDRDAGYVAALTDSFDIEAAALNAPGDNARAAALFAQLSGSLEALVGDYFSEAEIKRHIGAHALARAGLGGAEAGSALAALELFARDSWPVRIAEGGLSLASVFENLCEKSGVELLEGQLLGYAADTGKFHLARLSGDQSVKTRWLFFATPDAALAAGVDSSLSPLANDDKASVHMRLTLNEPVQPPAGDEKAIFQIADGLDELQAARDLVAQGQLPARPPLEFEISDKGEIIARTSYAPALFRDGDETRPWTGQDRQVIAARMKDRLAEHFDSLSHMIVKTEVNVIGPGEAEKALRFPNDQSIIIQPSRYNALARALALIDRALRFD